MRSLLTAALLLLAGCGHVVPGSLTGTGRPFDFKEPDCHAYLDTDSTKVEVRSLGSGGLFVRWRDEAILVGPQFSNPGYVRVLLRNAEFDEPRIRAALAALGTTDVGAILIGHSHYDHIGDVPIVAREPHVTGARIFVNASGDKLLNAYPDLHLRTTIIHAGDQFDLSPSFRVRVIASGHAPQVCRWSFFPCVYATGEVPKAWDTEWTHHRLRTFRGGETFAFDIEVHDGATTRFRIYYNDAAAATPLGQTTGDFDLAVLTLAQWNFVRDYPRDLLRVLQPRHVLVSHWDNFFSPEEEHFPFIMNIFNRSARQFLTVVKDLVPGGGAPTNDVCGVKTAHYTMAVPGSSLLFEPRVNEK
jgi:L-ascorbate metabolism protein UlaG (beta-lactamase superfamily)